MKKISKESKSRILSRLFSGDSYGEASEHEGFSKSTVKTIYDEFVGFAADSSLQEAAQEYQVSEEIDFFRELATEMRRADLSKKDLIAGVRLRSLMLKVGVAPEQLEEVLGMLDKHKEKYGDFVQAALKLNTYECEFGRTFEEIVSEYESKTASVKALRKEKTDLEKRIGDLSKEARTETLKLKELSEKSVAARAILDEYEATKQELAKYGLKTNDYPMIKKILNEIKRQGGEPGTLTAILREAESLANSILFLQDRLKRLEDSNETEKQRHKKEMQALEKEHNDRISTLTQQEIDLRKSIESKENSLLGIGGEIQKQNKRLDELKGQITAREQQVDGLLRTQAERLGTLADIDAVNEALAARKKELEQTETKIKENEALIKAAEAIAALLAKKPTDRDAIIQFLQLTRQDATYRPFDDMAREKLVKLMAEQGYVPKKTLETANREAKEEIDKRDGQIKLWKGVAKIREEKLEAFQKRLQQLVKEQDGKWEESIIERISNLAVEVAKKASPTPDNVENTP